MNYDVTVTMVFPRFCQNAVKFLNWTMSLIYFFTHEFLCLQNGDFSIVKLFLESSVLRMLTKMLIIVIMFYTISTNIAADIDTYSNWWSLTSDCEICINVLFTLWNITFYHIKI